ncbi:MAG: hypothetical protein A3F16_05475 [Deltaproteobacteria bacterium RIFCSPHIGHO2_12_FULL_43_9]|nr:MAG: hypothetical protein A3F16_05475 [Deltaproteobacteria bacterium RIFCSPHIGHO2_12_FULL_43_9]
MNRFTLLFVFVVLLEGCGVKGPPLPPMKGQDQEIFLQKERVGDVDKKSPEKDKKKKKKINAPFQF